MLSNWLKVSLLLCVFGFFRELRPSEPFSTEFFIGYRNLTTDDITQILYPLGTYSYMLQLIVVFLVTDLLRYKPVIILSALCGCMVFALMLWMDEFVGLILAQTFYGTFMATEVAYYTYIYAKVERNKYQMVTGHTRSAILGGRFLGAVFAQVLITSQWMNYRQLNYLSFGSQCISLVWSLLLPSVGISLYFYNQSNPQVLDSDTDDHSRTSKNDSSDAECSNANLELGSIEHKSELVKRRFSAAVAFSLIATHVKTSYSNAVVVQWSLWWSVAMCGFLQVQSYMQLLWKEIDATETDLYNGAVEAAITLLGAVSAFAAGLLDNQRYKRHEIWILTVFTMIEAALLLWSALTHSLWSCYVAYVLFGTIYHFMITIASASVASKLQEDCFALIFGINTLIALVLQSLLTFVTISAFALNVRIQYQVYAGWFLALAVVFVVIAGMKGVYVEKGSIEIVQNGNTKTREHKNEI